MPRWSGQGASTPRPPLPRFETKRPGFHRGAFLTGPAADPLDDDCQDGRTLAEQVDVEARHYRVLGTAFGDLMAETIEKLAVEVRYLDAATPDAYRDRREAALDAARDADAARMASARRCC